MIGKRRFSIFVMLISLFVAASCVKSPADVFDESANVRVKEAIAKAKTTILAHKEGWQIDYYPSADLEFGGYTIFAKFLSETQVTLTSDIYEDKVTSSYDIIAEAGPVLTFNTYNDIINLFTEPGLDNGGIGADDTGMKGDFEFSIQSVSDTLIVLLGKKSHNLIRMTPVGTEGFDAVSGKYQDASLAFDGLRETNFKLVKGNDTTGLTLSYNTFQLADDANSELLSFRVTPTGLSFFKEYELAGAKFSKLNYVAPSTQYPSGYYTNDSKSFQILPIAPPPPTLNEWFKKSLWFFAYSGVGATGRQYWDLAKTGLAGANLKLDYLAIGTAGGGPGLYLGFNGDGVNRYLVYTITLVSGTEDQVRLAFTGSAANITQAQYDAGIARLSTPLNGRTFKITANTTNKPGTVLLTDIGIPTNTFILTLNQITNPFDK